MSLNAIKSSCKLNITATVGSDTYTYTKNGWPFEDGKYYEITVKLTKQAAGAEGHALSASAIGEIVGTDGKAYAVADKDNLPEGVTAAGMVAYKDGSNGLAIALADEGQMYWATAKSTCEGKTAIGGYSWKLPTMDEWKQMFRANGGNENEFTGLNNALAAAGGDSSKLQESVYYWSSSEYYDDDVWDMNLFGEYGVRWYRDNKEDEAYHVRACLAF